MKQIDRIDCLLAQDRLLRLGLAAKTKSPQPAIWPRYRNPKALSIKVAKLRCVWLRVSR